MRKIQKVLQFLVILPIPLFPIVAPISDSSLQPGGNLMAQHEMPLTDRYPVASVNQVFRDNILLNLAYLRNLPKSSNPSWDEVRKPTEFEFKLDPNKTFAFHEDILPKYQGMVEKTSNAHFIGQEGFKSDGYLFGDGVCHLASLIYWVAKDAGLNAEAPTNHDFMKIADIPKEYGVSIYSNPSTKGSNSQQNLYITNNKSKAITFKFEYNESKVKGGIVENN